MTRADGPFAPAQASPDAALEMPDPVRLLRVWNDLPPAGMAEIRRAENPGDLRLRAAYYRILGGRRPNRATDRLVYVMPWIRHVAGGPGLGQALAAAGIHERRVVRVLTGESPQDLRDLKTLCRANRLVGDWTRIARTLWYWPKARRRALEDYYVCVEGARRAGTRKERT